MSFLINLGWIYCWKLLKYLYDQGFFFKLVHHIVVKANTLLASLILFLILATVLTYTLLQLYSYTTHIKGLVDHANLF